MSTTSPLDRASLAKTPEWRNVDLKTFRGEILPRDRPAVLRGLVAHWPLTRAGCDSPHALLEYIRARDPGRPLKIIAAKLILEQFLGAGYQVV